MPYEDAFTPNDMLDGYAPSGGAAIPATEPQPVADFDPRRDIDPMSRKLFDDIGAERHLKHKDKVALQSKLLAGISDVSAQRAKLENERRQSMMDNMRIQEMQGSIASMRQRQQTAVEQTAARATFTDALKGVMSRNDLDPVAKSMEIDRLTTENLGFVAADREAAEVVRTAKMMIPPPRTSSLTESRYVDAAKTGVPRDVLDRGDLYEIGKTEAILEARRQAESDNAAERAAAKKNEAKIIMDLADEGFRFIPKEERGMGAYSRIRKDDPNDYLIPEDHNRGNLLAKFVLSDKEYAQFETLSDSDKAKILNTEVRFRAMKHAAMKAVEEVKSDDDVAADRAVFGR